MVPRRESFDPQSSYLQEVWRVDARMPMPIQAAMGHGRGVGGILRICRWKSPGNRAMAAGCPRHSTSRPPSITPMALPTLAMPVKKCSPTRAGAQPPVCRARRVLPHRQGTRTRWDFRAGMRRSGRDRRGKLVHPPVGSCPVVARLCADARGLRDPVVPAQRATPLVAIANPVLATGHTVGKPEPVFPRAAA